MWPFPHPPIPRLFPGVASDTVREASGEALGPGRSSTSKHHISWDRAIWLLLHYESPWYSLFKPNQHIWGAVGGTVFETSLVDTSSEQQGWPSNIKCRQMSISLAVTCLFNFLLGSLCVDGFCNCFGLRFYKVPKYLEVMPEEYLHDLRYRDFLLTIAGLSSGMRSQLQARSARATSVKSSAALPAYSKVNVTLHPALEWAWVLLWFANLSRCVPTNLSDLCDY